MFVRRGFIEKHWSQIGGAHAVKKGVWKFAGIGGMIILNFGETIFFFFIFPFFVEKENHYFIQLRNLNKFL